MIDAEDALTLVRSRMRSARRDQGHVLFRQGDWGGELYFLREGALKFERVLVDGTVTLLDLVGPGQFFSTINAFEPAIYEVTATVLAPSVVSWIHATDLRTLVDRHPLIGEALLLLSARGLRDRHIRDLEMTTFSGPMRVARAIVDLATTFGRTGGGDIHIDLGLTQSELAQMLALNRRTVNQSLSSMVSRGWLTVERREVIIHDLDAIRRRAGLG